MKENTDSKWLKTACIICPENCGLEVKVENGHIVRVRGDKDNPKSRGYLCQKSQRLDFYQNNADRLTNPLRRNSRGEYEKISWKLAISEISEKLSKLRDKFGGESLAYYGGGSIGNHIGGIYAQAFKAAIGTPYYFSSIAQEKTGDFWVNGKLFGRQTCHITDDNDNAEVVFLLGTNPWQSHGFPRARLVLKEISKNPKRKLIVIDPRRTHSAKLADVHIQLKPGTDAFFLSAVLSTIIREGWSDIEFIKNKTVGYKELRQVLNRIPIKRFAEISGIKIEQLQEVARIISGAKSMSVRADLGIQHSLHSTLNSYLEKLLFLITGNFGRKGTNNLHSYIIPLIGHSPDASENSDVLRTPVTGMQGIGKMFPPNILPAEIDTYNPKRIRGLVIDSANPLLSAADTNAYRAAFKKLELLVVIDVAMSETAALADYILPPPTQFEKWEATFYCFNFPANFIHLRKPIFSPPNGVVVEPEIYRRLVSAMGKIPASFPLLKAVARLDRKFPLLKLYPAALKALLAIKPQLLPYASLIIAETLGETLPEGAKWTSPIWAAAHIYTEKHHQAVRKAGIKSLTVSIGDALFYKILNSRSGTTMSLHDYKDTWKFLRYPDKKIHLAIPSLLNELSKLTQQNEIRLPTSKKYPFLLSAGERQDYNANSLFRHPKWRLKNPDGLLRMHPSDCKKLGITSGDLVNCEAQAGKIKIAVEVYPDTQPGFVSIPHGYGMNYPSDENGERKQFGPIVNLLTSAEHCDPLTKTPYHKHVPVRIIKVE